MAPDGKIYVGLTGDTCLAVIEEPDLLGAACAFTWCGQSLGGRTGSHALPHRYKGALSSVGMMDRGSRTMQVYPTPASDGVWITGGRPARVVAFDLRGAVAAHWELNGDRSWIPRNGLAAGAYVLRLENRAGGVIGFARALFE